MGLAGYDDKEIGGKSIEECKALCDAETSFKCVTIDYRYSDQLCILSKTERKDAMNDWMGFNGWVHIAREVDVEKCNKNSEFQHHLCPSKIIQSEPREILYA